MDSKRSDPDRGQLPEKINGAERAPSQVEIVPSWAEIHQEAREILQDIQFTYNYRASSQKRRFPYFLAFLIALGGFLATLALGRDFLSVGNQIFIFSLAFFGGCLGASGLMCIAQRSKESTAPLEGMAFRLRQIITESPNDRGLREREEET